MNEVKEKPVNKIDRSIHPRVVGGTTKHEKVNTCKPYKSGGGALYKHQAELGRRRNAHSATLKSLPSQMNPGAFRTPGSMNQRCKS